MSARQLTQVVAFVLLASLWLIANTVLFVDPLNQSKLVSNARLLGWDQQWKIFQSVNSCPQPKLSITNASEELSPYLFSEKLWRHAQVHREDYWLLQVADNPNKALTQKYLAALCKQQATAYDVLTIRLQCSQTQTQYWFRCEKNAIG